jgi:hypothetical protein
MRRGSRTSKLSIACCTTPRFEHARTTPLSCPYTSTFELGALLHRGGTKTRGSSFASETTKTIKSESMGGDKESGRNTRDSRFFSPSPFPLSAAKRGPPLESFLQSQRLHPSVRNFDGQSRCAPDSRCEHGASNRLIRAEKPAPQIGLRLQTRAKRPTT